MNRNMKRSYLLLAREMGKPADTEGCLQQRG